MFARAQIAGIVALTAGALIAGAAPAHGQRRETIVIRGHAQTVYLYGPPSGDPVVVSSGDGGWTHLAPSVAEFLASRGCFVVGFDVRAYLTSFTSAHSTLQPEEEPGDFAVLVAYAHQVTGKTPLLAGVSEGAGLSVLAATNPALKKQIAGVIGLGLPDINELAWRWKDAIIYFTHKPPAEPTFSAAAIVAGVAPVPLAEIHSTADEFVPASDITRVMAAAREPKRLVFVKASDHRFSDNQAELDRRLIEAMAWVKQFTSR